MKIQAKDMYKTKKIILEEKYSRGSGKNKTIEVIGVVSPYINGDNYHKDEYMILDISGEQYLTYHYNILKISIIRNIPQAVRKQLDKIGQEFKGKTKKMEEYLLLKEELMKGINQSDNNLNKDIDSLKKLYTKEYGLYTKNEFSEFIDGAFKDIILKRLNKENYTFGVAYVDFTIYDNLLRFETELHTHKYAQEGALGVVYQEYDGSLHVNCDKDQEISIVNKFLKRHNLKNLNGLNKEAKKLMKQYKGLEIKVDHDIYVGDKNTLTVELLLFIEHNQNYKFNNEFKLIVEDILKKLLR